MLKLNSGPWANSISQPPPKNPNSGILEFHQGHSQITPAAPLDFDGDREKGHAFLNSCSLYYSICVDHFLDDQAHIHWALLFLKFGCASHFANQIIGRERIRRPAYSDWMSFELDFIDHFCPWNEQLSAIMSLEGASWHQGRDLVEDYIDHFTELTDLAEYHDNKMVVIKFRKGLNSEIQSKVALLGDGSPEFDDPQGWYEADGMRQLGG